MSENINNNFSQGEDKNTVTPIVIGGYTYPRNDTPNELKKAKKKGRAGFVIAMICVCVLVSAVIGAGSAFVTYNLLKTDEVVVTNDSQGTVIQHAQVGQLGDEVSENALVNAINKAYNSTVEISTERVSTNPFYGQFVTDGAGSGVIISDNGYIITCAHVIDGATTVKVLLTDGSEYVAEVIGSDAQTDIAVLKIEAQGLTSAIIGDSSDLIVGQTAIAIGNPLGELGGTVTDGIISALERDVVIDNNTYTLLQTNVAINPGNSGGGLFDINGTLIGVVNAKSSGSGIEGLGFAIPVNDAMEVATQLIDYGYIRGRVQMGVTVYEVTADTDYWTIRNYHPNLLDYVTDYGVYIIEFITGDFKYGDRIIAIDGISVSTLADIKSLLTDYSIGDTVEVTVARLDESGRSRMVSFDLTLSEATPTEAEPAPEQDKESGIVDGEGNVIPGTDNIVPGFGGDLDGIFGDLFPDFWN